MWGRKRKTRLDTLEARLAELAQENEGLRQQLAELDDKKEPVPGLDGGRAPRTVLVGGEEVELRPLSAKDWMSALEEIPSFLMAYSKAKVSGKPGMSAEQVEEMVTRVRAWIRACAVGEVEVARLTVPEAQHALNIIATMNGIDAQLGAFFRARFQPPAPGHGGEAVRDKTKLPN